MRSTASFEVLSVKIHAGVSAVDDWKNQKNSKHGYANMGVYISRIWEEETPQWIEPIFFSVKDIHDVITHAKFGDDRLRGSGVVAGQISVFPIDFAGRPYNTLTLPCERVIM